MILMLTSRIHQKNDLTAFDKKASEHGPISFGEVWLSSPRARDIGIPCQYLARGMHRASYSPKPISIHVHDNIEFRTPGDDYHTPFSRIGQTQCSLLLD